MKVYVVFIQNSVYQEIGNVHTDLDEALKEATNFQKQMGLCIVGYPGAVVIERELKDEKREEKQVSV